MRDTRSLPPVLGHRRDGRPIHLIAGGAPVMVRVGEVERTIEDAEKRLQEIEDELRALNEEVPDGQDLDEEQSRTWEELDTEHRDLAAATRKAQRQQRLQESRARWGSVQVGAKRDDPFDGDPRTVSEQQALTRARQVLDTDEHSAHLRADQKERLAKLLRTRNSDMDGDVLARLMLATENPLYRSAFQKYASGSNAFTSEEARAIEQVRMVKRALSVGGSGGADGGFAVPVLIDPTIIMTDQGSENDLLRLARVETITNDTWRGISSAGVTWKFDAEAAEATDNSPKTARPEVATKRADGFIPFSIEIGMDWPGFAENMSMLLGEGYDELLAEKLTVATNANEPSGLIPELQASTQNPNVIVHLASAGTLAAADIYGLWAALPQRFRRQANTAWLSSTDVQNTIRQLGTVDPNFSVDITQEAIPRMFGRQYPMNDFMEDVPTGSGLEPLLVVGDFRGFVVAQRAGMTVEFIPMLMGPNNRPTGERGWFAWARVGSGVVNPNGFRLLVNTS